MSKSLRELYLEWLTQQITIPSRGGKSFDELLRLLSLTTFIWNVANDDNRVSDGLDLRGEFIHYCGDQGIGAEVVDLHDAQLSTQVSILEVIIGLSRHLAFNAGGSAEGWAWQLIENLELHKMYDPITPRKREKITDTLDGLVWRTYERSGQGGLFPLAFPQEDQRHVELWYQMSAYIDENVTL